MTQDPRMPPELRAFGDDLVRAARARAPRRARAARRLRVAGATVAAVLASGGLATATGLVPTPFSSAPSAIVYEVVADGAQERVTCTERDGSARCRADARQVPLAQLAGELARRGTRTGRIDLVRLCRRGAGCRTLPAREAARAPGRGELVWVTSAGLRPARDGERVTLFGARSSVGARVATTYAVRGGALEAAGPVVCTPRSRVPLCRAIRSATRAGTLDTDALLARVGAEALVTETGRLCPLTGDRPCTALDPARARDLAARPAALAGRGVTAVHERQLTARGFAPKPTPPPPRKPRRR